jgi:hypothetical protein
MLTSALFAQHGAHFILRKLLDLREQLIECADLGLLLICSHLDQLS